MWRADDRTAELAHGRSYASCTVPAPAAHSQGQNHACPGSKQTRAAAWCRLHAWERAFEQRIHKLREAEMVHVTRLGMWQAANRLTFFAVRTSSPLAAGDCACSPEQTVHGQSSKFGYACVLSLPLHKLGLGGML